MEHAYELAAAASMLALIGYWISGRGRYTRLPSWRAARRAGKLAETAEDRQPWGQALRWMNLHDGLSRRLRRLVARAQRLAGRLAGPEAAFDVALGVYRLAFEEFRKASDKAGEVAAATIGPATASRMTVALFLGDVAVVSGVLMAENAQLPIAIAAVTALAIATAQFGIGKLLGAAVVKLAGSAAEKPGGGYDPATVVAMTALATLALLGTSLAGLLYGASFAWGFLVVTPALGAAALTIASHEPAHQRLHRASQRVRKVRRRFEATAKRWGADLGAAAQAYARANALAAREVVAPERAVAAAYEIIPANVHRLTEGAGAQTMLDDLQVTLLTITGSAKRLEENMVRLGLLTWGRDGEPGKSIRLDLEKAGREIEATVPEASNGVHPE